MHYQGASFRFYHQASATERGALFNPDYNLEELDFLRAHVPAGGVFVDVGANVGTYALALARHVGASGKVIAIEPHPVTHARLAFNNAASGFTQVRLVAAAAGAADGELLIETDGDNLGASHIVSGEAASQGHQGAVAAAAAHPRRGRRRHVDALKIDVEGFEDRVLTGFFSRSAADAVAPRGGDRASVKGRMAERLHRRHACARLCRDGQDPQQHAAGAGLNFPHSQTRRRA